MGIVIVCAVAVLMLCVGIVVGTIQIRPPADIAQSSRVDKAVAAYGMFQEVVRQRNECIANLKTQDRVMVIMADALLEIANVDRDGEAECPGIARAARDAAREEFRKAGVWMAWLGRPEKPLVEPAYGTGDYVKRVVDQARQAP